MDLAARNLFPFLLAFFGVLLGATPLYVTGYGAIAPDFALMAVFYWAIYRPDLFPATIAFAIGLAQDALTGTPMGMNALVLLIVHASVLAQRRFFQGKSFAVVWWAFSIVAMGAGLAQWMLTAALSVQLIDPTPGVFASVLTIAIYPFAAWALARMHHAVLPDRADVS
jgi:rod shape-determining protein MreD